MAIVLNIWLKQCFELKPQQNWRQIKDTFFKKQNLSACVTEKEIVWALNHTMVWIVTGTTGEKSLEIKKTAQRSLEQFLCLLHIAFLNGSCLNSVTLKRNTSPWVNTMQNLISHSDHDRKRKVLFKELLINNPSNHWFLESFFITVTNTNPANLYTRFNL